VIRHTLRSSVSSPLEVLSEEELAQLLRGPKPARLEPMKAKLTDRRFSDPAWFFERKLDGVRCLAFGGGDGVKLRSRTDHVLNSSYPEIAEALEGRGTGDFIADGEVVAFSRGITSFSRLQARMHVSDPERARRTGVAVYLYLFDLVYVDGHDLRQLPNRARKRVLRRAFSFGGPIRFLVHRNREGEAMYADACRRGLEGVIAKRAASTYTGKRSGDWLKFKCGHEQELVIGGFTAPQGSRTDFGALLVGYCEDGQLRYAGKVGTGFDRKTLTRLGSRLRELEIDESPFEDVDPVPRGTHWVRPELVGQFGFAEWTRDGRLRHPRYLGLRDDKPAREVVRERPS
jgi:DNA ligase D-like protein (predicted ligase)